MTRIQPVLLDNADAKTADPDATSSPKTPSPQLDAQVD